MPQTGRRIPDLVSRVVTELRRLNFEFESEDDAANRIISLVEVGLIQPNGDSVLDVLDCAGFEGLH